MKRTVSCFPVMGVIPRGTQQLTQILSVASPLWGLFHSLWSLNQMQKVASPLWGLFSDIPTNDSIASQLLPRYGGYSATASTNLTTSQKLLPRYGGYSTDMKKYKGADGVASPLWGLFFVEQHLSSARHSCFPVMGVILVALDNSETGYRLLPRYGGYSFAAHTICLICCSCFPVMGVILARTVEEIYGKVVASPLWGLFQDLKGQNSQDQVASPLWGLF